MSDATQQSSDQSADGFSFLDLPDEELKKYALGSLPMVPVPEVTGAAAEDTNDEGTAAPAGQAAGEETPAAAKEGEGTGQEPAAEAAQGAAGDEGAADASKAPVKDEGKAQEAVPPKEEDKSKVDDTFDYKTAYQKLLAPFKANGREIQVESVDEAIQLMQMGANYNKKMAGLKPSLTLLKLLENNGLLSEEKISYLIDLDKKVPGAVNKLVKDSGLDPMDLDAKKAEDYKPSAKTVDVKEMELDAVMDEIQDTEAFPKTIDIVGKKWDQASRNAVAEFPQVLKVINAHVQSGVYDKIVAQVERQRLFGKLNGLSDLDAYRQVGDEMNSRGEFASLGRQEQPSEPEKKIVQPDTSKAEKEEALKEKKRAASGVKSVSTPAPAQDFNPLSLSDDEFMKIRPGKY